MSIAEKKCFNYIQLAEVMPFVLEISLSAISILTGQKKSSPKRGGSKMCFFLDT